MQTTFRLEARWTGGPPPPAVAAALEALPSYDGDALMAAVRVLSPAAMHTGFALHELRERCELRRVRRDEHLWMLELRGPVDGQADVCCVLDFLDALGFRHVSVAGPDEDGAPQVLTATLWRQRFVEPDADDGEEDFDDDDGLADEDGQYGEDDEPGDIVFGMELDEIDLELSRGEALPELGPALDERQWLPIRALFAGLAAVDSGSVRDCLATFALVGERLQALHDDSGDDDGLDSGAGAFLALAQAHGEDIDGGRLRAPLYGHYAGLAALALDNRRLGSLRLLVARAAQFSTVLGGLLATAGAGAHADSDRSGLIGIARAASGFVDPHDD